MGKGQDSTERYHQPVGNRFSSHQHPRQPTARRNAPCNERAAQDPSCEQQCRQHCQPAQGQCHEQGNDGSQSGPQGHRSQELRVTGAHLPKAVQQEPNDKKRDTRAQLADPRDLGVVNPGEHKKRQDERQHERVRDAVVRQVVQRASHEYDGKDRRGKETQEKVHQFSERLRRNARGQCAPENARSIMIRDGPAMISSVGGTVKRMLPIATLTGIRFAFSSARITRLLRMSLP